MSRENVSDTHLLDPHRSAPLQDIRWTDRGETTDPHDSWHIAEWDDVFWALQPSAKRAIDLSLVAP